MELLLLRNLVCHFMLFVSCIWGRFLRAKQNSSLSGNHKPALRSPGFWNAVPQQLFVY